MTATTTSATTPLATTPAPRWMTRLRGSTVSTPALLRLGMALAVVPIAVLAIAVHLGVTRNADAVNTVGQDATQGITSAQAIKASLTELDRTVVEDLLEPVTLGSSGFPDDYNGAHRELVDILVLAASNASPGAAFQLPLSNIDYALGHYHALVKDSFAASAAGNAGRAAQLYDRAHEVMDRTLVAQADLFDKANTYLLNTTYDRHKADSSSSVRFIVVSWIVLLGGLAVVQGALARKFRRIANVALATATLLGVFTGGFALARLDASSTDLTVAREHAFDAVHALARARATVVSARVAEGQLLLDPSDPAAAKASFDAETARLFRVQGVSELARVAARAGDAPDGAGGFLANVLNADVSVRGNAAAREALVAFGDYLVADDGLRALVASGDLPAAREAFTTGAAFTALTTAVDDAQSVDQDTFDVHARAAADATRNVDRLSVIGAALMLGLIVLGLYQRLREYGD